jgi:hypothetical protein
MRYLINSTGQIIIADQAFMDAHHTGDYTLVPEPAPPPIDQNDLIKHQIKLLEDGENMPRATREFMLLMMEAQFTPEQLALNPGYSAVKTFDLQIKALRDQLA